MAAKGQPKTGGRKKGTPNKANPTAIMIMEKYNVSGIDGLCQIAAGLELECTTHFDKDSGEYVSGAIKPTFDQRLAAFKELASYEAPKLKSVEHSGNINIHEAMLDELE